MLLSPFPAPDKAGDKAGAAAGAEPRVRSRKPRGPDTTRAAHADTAGFRAEPARGFTAPAGYLSRSNPRQQQDQHNRRQNVPGSVPRAGAHPAQLQQPEGRGAAERGSSSPPQKHEPLQLKRGYSEEPGGFCGRLLCFCFFFFLSFFFPPNPLAPALGQLSTRALLIHRVSPPLHAGTQSSAQRSSTQHPARFTQPSIFWALHNKFQVIHLSGERRFRRTASARRELLLDEVSERTNTAGAGHQQAPRKLGPELNHNAPKTQER